MMFNSFRDERFEGLMRVTEDDGSSDARRGSKDAPEPPTGFDPRVSHGALPPSGNDGNGRGGQDDFQKARNLVSAAQIMSLVSLFIGGVILSSAAIAVAFVGYRRISAAMAEGRGSQTWQLLRRSAIIALAMSILALCLNVISFVIVYPMVMEAVQSGNLNSLLGGSEVAPPSTQGNSTWG